MRVFVAGSSGAIGKSLVPHLLENGYEVVALVRTTQKAKEVEAIGAKIARSKHSRYRQRLSWQEHSGPTNI